MRHTALITSALFALAGCASGPDTDPATEQVTKGDVDERVESVLRDVSSLLGGSRQFSFHAEITYEELVYEATTDEGSSTEEVSAEENAASDDAEVNVTIVELSGRTDVTVSRPDKLHVSHRDDTERREFFLDGSTATMVAPDDRVYATFSTPGTIDASLDVLWEHAGVAPPLSDLVYEEPYTRLAPKITRGTYAGLVDVDGTSCHHILLFQETMDWELWVEAGDKPLPRRMQITYRELPLAPVFVADFGGWNFEKPSIAATFRFEPPEGAIEVDAMATPIAPDTHEEGR